MIDFGTNVCGDLEVALEREWLETNGIGGFASSTIVGLNTRRYHGLLTAAVDPPVGRMVLLSKLEESLVVDGTHYELSSNQYPGVVHPSGHRMLSGFRLDPFPVFTYDVDGLQLEKTVFMLHGSNTTVVRYELRSPAGGPTPVCELGVRVQLAFRDYHALGRERFDACPDVVQAPSLVTVRPYESGPTLHIAHDANAVDTRAWWYRNLEYARERERGFDYAEDLFSPFALRFDLTTRTEATLVVSTEPHEVAMAEEYRIGEIERRAALVAGTPDDPFVRQLVLASDQYVVDRGTSKTVIAGYHWFGDWGRDTMIALPGLTMTTGRFGLARSILETFARFVDRGMLPNRFPDAGAPPEYNNVDSTLWFFEAIGAYAERTGDYEFVRARLYDTLREIIAWHVRGTRYGIRVDTDGLLASGEDGVQLTWMDARVNGWVVTPRRGKPVEIQALWYNALRVVESFARRFGDSDAATEVAAMAERAKESFDAMFWNEEAGCLYDVVDGDTRDASLRPNQVFAASLRHTMLAPERARRMLEVVERELLTPCGLRSLAPSDPRYRPRYEGDAVSRDGSYHQGTVWPWLLGPFVAAYVKANGGSTASRVRAASWIEPMRAHLSDACLGHISEIFAADPPHRPVGCVAQAWSVAEVLRCFVEDVGVHLGEGARGA